MERNTSDIINEAIKLQKNINSEYGKKFVRKAADRTINYVHEAVKDLVERGILSEDDIDKLEFNLGSANVFQVSFVPAMGRTPDEIKRSLGLDRAITGDITFNNFGINQFTYNEEIFEKVYDLTEKWCEALLRSISSIDIDEERTDLPDFEEESTEDKTESLSKKTPSGESSDDIDNSVRKYEQGAGTRTWLYYTFGDFVNKFKDKPLQKMSLFGAAPNFDVFWRSLPSTYRRDREIMAILNTELPCVEFIKPEPVSESETESIPESDPTVASINIRNKRANKGFYRIVIAAEPTEDDPFGLKDVREKMIDSTEIAPPDAPAPEPEPTPEPTPEPEMTRRPFKIRFYDSAFKEYDCDENIVRELMARLMNRLIQKVNADPYSKIVNFLSIPIVEYGSLMNMPRGRRRY